jgi:hypothetical protein
MRFFLTKRSIKSKILTILFILLFLTLISSLLVSNALAIDAQSELPRAKASRLPASTTDSIPLTGYGGLISTGLTSLRPVGTRTSIDNKLYKPNTIHHYAKAAVHSSSATRKSDILTFDALGFNTKTLNSENGQEISDTFNFVIDIDDTAHKRISIHLQYKTDANRPSTDFEMMLTINEDYTIKDSIFRYIESDTKHWRHIEIPYEYLKDGANQIAVNISFKSLSNAISRFTIYGESYFEITETMLIQSNGDYQLSDLGVMPSDTYEDRVVVTSIIGSYYSSTFEPQVEFFLQGNMTSVNNAQLDLVFQKDVPTDCEVTYNIYVNDKALFDEDKLLEETRIQIALTNLKAGRNSIQFQILINSYRVSEGKTPYTFRVQLGDDSKVSFSSSNFDTESNSEISIIPSFLGITLKYKRSFKSRETKVQTLSYVDTNDSGKIKTLRIREEKS